MGLRYLRVGSPLLSESVLTSPSAVALDGVRTRGAKALCLGALAAGLLIAGFGPAAPSAGAAPTTTIVELGQHRPTRC